MGKPTFEHRHYVEMARIISKMPPRAVLKEEWWTIREWVAMCFIDGLAGSNPKFDAQRFYDAAIGNPQSGRDK